MCSKSFEKPGKHKLTQTRIRFKSYVSTLLSNYIEGLNSCPLLAFLQLYDHISGGKSSSLFITCTHYNATPVTMSVALYLHRHSYAHSNPTIDTLIDTGPRKVRALSPLPFSFMCEHELFTSETNSGITR